MKTLGISIMKETLRNKIEGFFDKNLCKVSLDDEFQVVISSFGHDIIIVNNKKAKGNRDYYVNENSTIVLDPGFKETIKTLKGETIIGKSIVAEFLNAFALNSKLSLVERYHSLMTYNQKKEFAKLYLPEYSPDNEFLLIDNDNVMHKYTHDSMEVTDFKNDLKIIVSDSSIYLIHRDGERYIDTITHGKVIGKKWYPNDGLFQLSRSTQKACDIVQTDGKGNQSYFKNKIKPGVNLKEQEYYKVEELNQREFTLTVENDVFVLKDQKGKIGLSAPDLSFIAMGIS